MNDGLPYIYNPNMLMPNNNFNPNFDVINQLKQLEKRLDNLEKRVNRLEKKVSKTNDIIGMNMSNNEYYPPANDNYML